MDRGGAIAETKDIVVTWPSHRELRSYLIELCRAEEEKKVILFKVSGLPRHTAVGRRCYMVHSGNVRGYTEIIGLQAYGEGDPPIDPVTGQQMGVANYIVRDPHWWQLYDLPAMKGFQGFRYAPKHWRELVSSG